ncbi:MAG: leucine-rich repeat domain-containing protein, partial [Alistipes sp.]|nr:leucine-rich repeat domain-containing protein [Alistipes sp.]
MKRIFTLLVAALAFAACTQNDVEELTANRQTLPDTLTVGFEGGDTRIQLNEAQKTVWNAGDEVSVFFQSYTNMKWTFQGEDGDRSGVLKAEDKNYGEQVMDDIIIVYPYSSDYRINLNDKTVLAELPAVQHYLNGSYGKGGNIMVAAGDFDSYLLRSVCGWLRIDLTGDGQEVRKITLRGNNGEQLAGLVYVDAQSADIITFANDGGFEINNTVSTEITLDCSAGVVLDKEPKSFYIGVLPQTFEGGVTITAECSNGTYSTISTTKTFTLKRNHIKPINGGKYDGKLPEVYELAYRTNDGEALAPLTTEGFGDEFKENIFDAATGEGKLIFDGAITAIPNQAFGLCENLTWIDLPLGITSIGASAFSGCSSMEEITIPASVASVGEGAFSNCTGKAYINCNMPGTEYGSNPPVSFSSAGFTEVVIGDSVTTIGYRAFYDCDSLTSVTIGDSVTTIEGSAFRNCRSLTSVTIGNSVTTIRGDAFIWCTDLTSVTIPDSVTTIGYAAFAYCDSLTSVYCEATTPPSLDRSDVFDYNASGRAIYVPKDSVRQY